MASMKSIYIDPDKKQIDPVLLGLWEQRGYGRILEIVEGGATIYHYTRSFYYKDPYKANFGLADSYSFFEVLEKNTRLILYRFDYGDKTREYPNDETFRRINALPETCVASLDQPKFTNPIFVFELLWSTFDQYYAFFEERGVDWDQVYQDYRPKVSADTDEEALFSIFSEILSKLKDGHIYLNWGDKLRFHQGGGRLLERLRAAFTAQTEVDEFGKFTWKWYSGILDGVTQEIIDGEVHRVADDKLIWGHINPDIGYLFLSLLTGFGPEGATKPEQLELLQREFDAIVKEFKDKKAVIIDLSHNSGGFEAAGHLIASRFADKERHVLDEYTRETDSPRKKAHYLVPSERGTFTGPIYVLTSEVTVSAAEVLVLRLKAFPYVTHVGGRTRGYLSSILNKPLPNDFRVTLSNEYWVPPSGKVYEGLGVKPDIESEVFPDSKLFGGHRHAVASLIKRIERDLGR